jgi:isopentenyl phosphate kinase
MNDLLSFGFPGISIPPVAILINRGKLISFMDAEIFQRVLDINCIPVTFGDVVPDDTLGFSICSGDSIIQKLAEIYKPSKVIFLSDVDGLYTSNPVLDSRAKLIPNLTEKSFSSACTSENVNPDVTGGIYLKAKIALNMSKAGVETYIINGRVSGRLTGALRGDKVTGTMA